MKKLKTILVLTILPLILMGQDLTQFQINGLWGYKDSLDNIVIEPQYQYAKKFQNEYAIIAHNNLFGAIDKSNKLVIYPRHEFLKYIGNEHFIFGSATEYFGEFDLGIMTSKNDTLIYPEFYHIRIKNEKYVVTKQFYKIIASDGMCDTREINSKYGVVDRLGNVILEPKYGWIKFLENGYMTIRKDKNGKSALLDNSFEQLTGFEYSGIGQFYHGLSAARNEEFCGFLNLQGEEQIEFKYEGCYLFIDSLALVKSNGKVGVIDVNNQIILDFKFKALGIPYMEQIPAYNGLKMGMVNLKGEIIHPFEYEKRKSELKGITAFLKDDKWKVWSYEKGMILPDEYDEIDLIEGDIINVLGFGKIKPKKYNQSIAFVRVKEYWGVINSEGKILVPIYFSKREVYGKLKSFAIPTSAK